MPETLREFVERRLQELLEAERPLREQLIEIERERKELERTAKLIGADEMYRVRANQEETQKKTIKEAVIEILSSKPTGLAALDILRELNFKLDTQYLRTSLSPQLSRLKKEGKIRQNGIVWSLAKPDQS